MVEPPEFTAHSFIIKIWLEEMAPETGRARWRGYITHVPGGERQHVQDLGGIDSFIVSYLVEMGAEPGLRWRLHRRYDDWKKILRHEMARLWHG